MTTDLMFTHASLNTFNTDAQNAEDVGRLVHGAGGDRLWIALTECGQGGMVRLVKDVVGDTAQVVNPDSGDILFLVHPDVTVKGYGGDIVLPAVRKPAKDGGHSARCTSWVRMKYHGEDITHTAIHNVTARTTHKQPGGGLRLDEQVKLTEAMAAQMVRFGKGRRIATGSGDLNGVLPRREDLQRLFDHYGLTTTAQETGVLTPTHDDRRIDYVWTYDADGRATVNTMAVRRGPRWHTDHDPIDVWATIA